MYSSGAVDSIKLLKLSAERVDFGRGCNRACCTPGQPRCNTIAAGCLTSYLIEQCSSGPFVRSMSTWFTNSGFKSVMCTEWSQLSMDVTLVGIGIVDVKVGILRYAAILASQCVLQHLCVHGGLFERME